MTEMEMTSLLIKLANLGVTGIKVSYDGGGDSGAVEWIGYTTVPCEDPNDVEDKIDAWSDKRLAELDQEAHELIESFAESAILDDIENWWNNEGGWGELSICVPSGEYMVNNNVRVTHSENYLHDGSLIKRTEE